MNADRVQCGSPKGLHPIRVHSRDPRLLLVAWRMRAAAAWRMDPAVLTRVVVARHSAMEFRLRPEVQQQPDLPVSRTEVVQQLSMILPVQVLTRLHLDDHPL